MTSILIMSNITSMLSMALQPALTTGYANSTILHGVQQGRK